MQASSFEEAARTAPVQTRRIREELEAAKDADPLVTLEFDESTPREQIEERLEKGEADLAAVDARRADFEGRLTHQQNQLEAISRRLTEARQQQEEVTAALEVLAGPDDSQALAQAKRWVLDTRYATLSAEIKLLDQELLSRPMRVDLLEARRNREAASVEGIGARVTLLGELVNSKRRLEAEEAKVEAEEVRRETEGLHPLLMQLSERNSQLTDELNPMAARLDVLDREQAQAKELTKRIAADYKDAEATLEAGGLSQGIGRLLLEQRESLPDVLPYRRKARIREERIAAAVVQRLHHQAEARRIADLDQAVAELEAEITGEKTQELREKLLDLVRQRQILLDKALEADEFYLPKLRDLDTAEHELLDAVGTYNDFLNRHLLWLRSADMVLAVWITRLAVNLNPVETGGTIARLGFLVYSVVLFLYFYRVLHPRRSVLAHLRIRHDAALLLRAYPLWFPLLLVFPLGLAVLALAGYIYSADMLYYLFQYSLWMIVGLVVLFALALRWLLVASRRLTYEAAVERRQAELGTRNVGESESGDEDDSALQFEEPEVDLEALSDDSRALVKFAMIFAGLAGLLVIWSPVLPALQIFDTVTLWYETAIVDGEQMRVPVTLANVGLALIYAIGAGVLAKRLPAVLEIILLQRTNMSSGGRYTVTTLTSYGIVAIGLLLALGSIGARWSHFQWLVAALGVGIGFGLQEIVANFISGLIILFEHPIRVGDVVTVGDTSGVVTKIRIRATTIRSWDRKELLVPNKEFITNRLLNWTLSDQVTRIEISVGVAYGTDVEKALALMKEAAEEHEHVLHDPSPILAFEGFGENSLTLILRSYIDSIDHRIATRTELHKSINRKFEQAGIVIAFPQQDLHLDTQGPLRVRIEDARNKSLRAAPSS